MLDLLVTLFRWFLPGPDEKIYGLFLLSSLALAMLSWLRAARASLAVADGAVRQPLRDFLFPRAVWLSPSSKADYAYFVVNRFLLFLLLDHLVLVTGGLSTRMRDALVNAAGPASLALPTPVAIAAFTIASALAIDVGIFLAHWLQHHVPLLWEFHKTHHSAESLNPITVYRMHPVDDLGNTILSVGLQSLVTGVFAWAAPGVHEATWLGVNACVFLFYLVGVNLRHSHVWVSWGAAIEHVFISPAQHQIHHSVAPEHWNKNLGYMLAVWDWLAGSLVVAGREPQAIRFGSGAPGDDAYHGPLSLYLQPFRAAFSRRGPLGAGAIAVAIALPPLVAWGAVGKLHDTRADAGDTRPIADVPAAVPATVELDDMTWPEVRAAIRAGKTTVIVPTGGLEQNGPHMVLGKHNKIVVHAAEKIAEQLGDALVAPLIPFSPAGDISPPTDHMRFPGTVSLREDTLEAMLEDVSRSLLSAGFTKVALIADHGWAQEAEEHVAKTLGRQVIAVTDYYDPDVNGEIAYLEHDGETEDSIGDHAGIRDTSELLAVDSGGVHVDRIKLIVPGAGLDNGDPSRASAQRGRELMKIKIDAAVRQIRGASASRP